MSGSAGRSPCLPIVWRAATCRTEPPALSKAGVMARTLVSRPGTWINATWHSFGHAEATDKLADPWRKRCPPP